MNFVYSGGPSKFQWELSPRCIWFVAILFFEGLFKVRYEYCMLIGTSWVNCSTGIRLTQSPSGQNLEDSVGNLRVVWSLEEGIHAEKCDVSGR